MNLYGSDPGICAATNGGTHTTFEDLAIMRAIPGVEVYDPADGVQLAWLLRELAGRKGVHYIRTTRKQMPDIYREGSDFQTGKANVLREGRDILLIASGLALKPAIEAAGLLNERGLETAVVDMFTIAPLDADTIRSQMAGKKMVVTVENHSITNGLGAAVAEIMAEEAGGILLRRIGIRREFGQVGSVDYLKEYYGLTERNIADTVMESL